MAGDGILGTAELEMPGNPLEGPETVVEGSWSKLGNTWLYMDEGEGEKRLVKAGEKSDRC